MKAVAFTYFFVIAVAASGQNKFEWSENRKLSIEDFLGSGTQIGDVNIYSVQTGGQIEFAYQMSNAEFMMTKNWNEKVKGMFDRSMAYLVAPNDSVATALINFAQFDFDLVELHCRKLRKDIYESKTMFSNATIFQPLYDKVHRDYQERHVQVAKETDIGRNSALLRTYHNEVLVELQNLSDFCRTCKPAKKKK